MAGQLGPCLLVLLRSRLVYQGVMVQGILLHSLNPEYVRAGVLLDNLGNVLDISQGLAVPHHHAGAGVGVDSLQLDILRHGEVCD